VGDNWKLSRSEASRIVVWIDLLVIFLFVCAVYKLKDYQNMSIQDYKNGQLRVGDFSVFLPEIPINPMDYNNNPELLKAMIATHIEDIIMTET